MGIGLVIIKKQNRINIFIVNLRCILGKIIKFKDVMIELKQRAG